MARFKKRITKAERKRRLIKASGKVLSRANRAWRKGNMKEAERLTTTFRRMSKRIDR